MPETVTLDYQARYFRRRVVTTDMGREVLIDAPHAHSYADGDTVQASDGTVLTIRAGTEPLTQVLGQNLVKLAWHIGNRHTPAEVRPDCLLIQRDHVLENMLQGLGAEIRHVECPFQPEGGAYGHGRTHGHSHSHDPQDDPNAHIPHRRDGHE